MGRTNKWLLLGVATFLALFIGPVGFIYLLVLPFLPAIIINKRNILVSAPVLFSLNVVTAIINAVLLDTLNVPVTQFFMVLITGTEAATLLYARFHPIDFKVAEKARSYIYAIYILFLLAIGARLLSVIGLEAPILHDPQAHAVWAHRIGQEQAIDYFYSPGLHIWAWLMNGSFDIGIARAVHITTNFFSAFSVLLWPVAVYVFTKRGQIALWTGVVALLAPLPQFLYFMAGKNSFVMSVPFIGLATLLAYRYYLEQSRLNFLLLFVVLLGIGLIHYPAFGFAAGFALIYYLFCITEKGVLMPIKQPATYVKRIFVLCLPVIASLVLIGGNVAVTKSETKDVQIVSSHAEARAFHQRAQTSESVPAYETVANEVNTPTAVAPPLPAANNLRKEYFAFSKSLPKDIGIILLGSTIIGLYFLLAMRPRSAELIHYRKMLLAVLGAGLFILYVLTIYPVEAVETTRDTGFLLMPFLGALPLAWLLARLSKRRLAAFIVIATVALAGSYSTFVLFQEKSATRMVDKADLQAYEWIDQNVDDSEKFIGSSSFDPRRSSIVFATDGALWLPVFTDNEISAPFHELGFVSVDSHINYEYVQRLGSDNEKQVTAAAASFKDRGFDYLYIDSSTALGPAKENLLSYDLATIVYANDGVAILKLN